jgi:hypothetical protein
MQLLEGFKEKIRYWKLREEALDCVFWRIRFARNYGPVARGTTVVDEGIRKPKAL